jgi:FAD/FMN-containing dehydrogenase
MSTPSVIDALRARLGDGTVRDDPSTLALMATDLWDAGALPVAVVQPRDTAAVAAAVEIAAAHDHAVVPRGGGLTYTGGYQAPHGRCICLDLSAMNRILRIAPEDLTVTVEAGATWRDIHAALQRLRLRLPFFGTSSGAGATVGGGLSHGALFFGSARYGSAADQVLGLELVLADGRRLHTGREAVVASGAPLVRTYGPDLTGLFLHDGGSFGVKTQASFRLIEAPAAEGYASFAFASLEPAAAVLSAVARAGIAEDAYVLDPAVTGATDLPVEAALRTLGTVLRHSRGPVGALRTLLDVARGGQRPVPAGAWSLHLVAAARRPATVGSDLAAARRIALKHGGRPVAATIPRVTRADPFGSLDGVLGPDGRRWAALNAKVNHSEGPALTAGFEAVQARHAAAMARHGVSITRLVSAMGPLAFSFETVFHWRDAWLPLHRASLSAARRAALVEPPENPGARSLVAQLREDTLDLFRAHGATSNQIGRTYPFLELLEPATADLLRTLKAQLDPRGLMNPGALGL